VYLTYFYLLGYLHAKNYQILWIFDKVLTKTIWVIFWHTLYVQFVLAHAKHSVKSNTK